MKITDAGVRKIGEALDKLMTVDISARGSIAVLYEAARAQQEDSLTYSSIQLLKKSIKPGDYVFIVTGWADQYWNVPQFGESDGPPGAVALARSIRIALEALPIIVTDDYLVEGMKKIVNGSGMHCSPPDNLAASIDSSRGFACVPTAAVIPFPQDAPTGELEAARLIEFYKPAMCISIERGGMNEQGRIHGMGGFDYTDSQGKLDYLFLEATRRGITTMGIGDGGNEIGMANIAETIREKVNHGIKIVPSTKVDLLVPATISNWGGYAISCLLAASTGELDAMVAEDIEDRVLKACADADFHDTIGATNMPSVDGCRAPIHLALIKLMRESVMQGMRRHSVDS